MHTTFDPHPDALHNDPANPALLDEAAVAAYEAQQFDQCDALLQRREAVSPLTPPLLNLKGLCALATQRFDTASHAFEALSATDTSFAVRYNLAYAKAMLGRFAETIALLDEPILAAMPAASELKTRALYLGDRPDDAITLAARYADDPQVGEALRGLLAIALFDRDGQGDADRPTDRQAARHYADRAAHSADGLTARALLLLTDGLPDQAYVTFGDALALSPEHSRAKLGIGLALLALAHGDAAAAQLDNAVKAFNHRADLRVACGWAHLLAGERRSARACFAHATQLDHELAEAWGALAVFDWQDGKPESARSAASRSWQLNPDNPALSLYDSLRLAVPSPDAMFSETFDARIKNVAGLWARHCARFRE
ncbi:hypothetical protein [Paraburkholderia sp.]|uniref:hypothetical protein n=1 Tax=Paraburkholderia sp. TaxID=1926495 RepID=UPI0023A5531F|nr:hypothetical protein [Paraburkholderia sp.]MDE1182549.1 hypothetical protein [Paraburkholderia sp.]